MIPAMATIVAMKSGEKNLTHLIKLLEYFMIGQVGEGPQWLNIPQKKRYTTVYLFLHFGAQDWIRTSTSLRTLRPEHSASTNFATWALLYSFSGTQK